MVQEIQKLVGPYWSSPCCISQCTLMSFQGVHTQARRYLIFNSRVGNSKTGWTLLNILDRFCSNECKILSFHLCNSIGQADNDNQISTRVHSLLRQNQIKDNIRKSYYAKVNGCTSRIPNTFFSKSYKLGHRIYQLGSTADSAHLGQNGYAAQLVDYMP